MPSQEEREKRKQTLAILKNKQREDFEKSLPMSRDEFASLFNFLETELNECDDTLRLTHSFLLEEKVMNIDETIEWLKRHSAYCDCEVLSNVQELFD